MSILLESLGRGLVPRLRDVFDQQMVARASRRVLSEQVAACPTSVDALCQLGIAALHDQDYGAAQRNFRGAHELAPDATLPEIGLACVQDELGNLNEALQHATQVAENDPQDPAAAFAVALCYERRRDICSAADWYQQAVDRCSTLRNAHERLAAIAIRRGDLDAACGHYETLSELDPGDLDVLVLWGSLSLKVGRTEKAIEIFQQALLIEPELHDERLLDEPSSDDAEALLQTTQQVESLVAKYPGASEFRVQLGDLYARQGEDERAVHQYEVALDLQPMFLEATVKLGTQHMRAARYLEAARSFNDAGELNDRLLTAFVGLGLAQQANGDELEAEGTFDLAASLAPNSMLLQAEAARLRMRANDPDGDHTVMLHDLCQRLDQQRRYRPQDAGVHYRLAILRHHLGHTIDGLRFLESAVQLHPSFSKAVLQFGLLQRTRDEVSAQRLLASSLAIDPQLVRGHYDLGLLFAQPLRFELALEELRRVGGAEAKTAEDSLILSLQNVGLLDRAAGNWRCLEELAQGFSERATRAAL